MVPDFGGYVTRYGVKCSDGRTILAHAFQPQDGHRIPLVYQHQHKEIDNVLGHLLLEHRNDGVYRSSIRTSRTFRFTLINSFSTA
jgi:UDP-3-O-acyl-N-acetylglucosamine deacetylase